MSFVMSVIYVQSVKIVLAVMNVKNVKDVKIVLNVNIACVHKIYLILNMLLKT